VDGVLGHVVGQPRGVFEGLQIQPCQQPGEERTLERASLETQRHNKAGSKNPEIA